jgi:endothelin-converting enzyme/putative endopeptidase
VGVGRLGLPIRLLFFTRKNTKEKRDKYEQHIARMLQFIGEPMQAKASAAKILALEIRCLIHVWIE